MSISAIDKIYNKLSEEDVVPKKESRQSMESNVLDTVIDVDVY